MMFLVSFTLTVIVLLLVGRLLDKSVGKFITVREDYSGWHFVWLFPAMVIVAYSRWLIDKR
jgi:hypothetical protein